MKYLFFFLAINFTFSQTNVFDCARTGTAEEMEAFYNTNPKLVDALNERGISPLTLAAYYNNINVCTSCTCVCNKNISYYIFKFSYFKVHFVKKYNF